VSTAWPSWSRRTSVTLLPVHTSCIVTGATRGDAAATPRVNMNQARTSRASVDDVRSACMAAIIATFAMAMSRHLRALVLSLQKFPLAFETPAVAGEPAIAPYDPMAGNRHRDRIGGTGLGDGAHRAWLPDALRDAGIAGGSARGNIAECLPDPFLEGGAAHVQRQVQPGRGR